MLSQIGEITGKIIRKIILNLVQEKKMKNNVGNVLKSSKKRF